MELDDLRSFEAQMPPEVIVTTRRGTRLSILASTKPPLQRVRSYEAERSKPLHGWVNRKPATGGYNCYGHILASRRAVLPLDDEDLVRCLREDGYRPLSPKEPVATGDVVLYRDPKVGILHMGAVICQQRIAEDTVGFTGMTDRMLMRVLSKWDQHWGEDVHRLHDVPAAWGSPEQEIWTDRPRPRA